MIKGERAGDALVRVCEITTGLANARSGGNAGMALIAEAICELADAVRVAAKPQEEVKSSIISQSELDCVKEQREIYRQQRDELQQRFNAWGDGKRLTELLEIEKFLAKLVAEILVRTAHGAESGGHLEALEKMYADWKKER